MLIILFKPLLGSLYIWILSVLGIEPPWLVATVKDNELTDMVCRIRYRTV